MSPILLGVRRALGSHLLVVLLIAFVAGTLAGLLAGCGGSGIRAARTVVEVTAIGVAKADDAYAKRYAVIAAQALREAESLAEYHGAMRAWDRGVVAFASARSSLLAVQRGIDAWENGDRSGFEASIPCLAATLVEIKNVLEAAGVPIPGKLNDAINLVAPYIAGQCTAPVTP